MNTFPYPTLEYTGEEVLARWTELREEGKTKGFYPIIIGDREDLAGFANSIDIDQDQTASIIAAASKLNIDSLLRERELEEPELMESLEIGTWPKSPCRQGLVAHTDMRTAKPKPKVLIAKIPTIHSYEVPAFLHYGGWNNCPDAASHVAIHKFWNERYGAEIIAVTSDVIECKVSSPPLHRDESMILAKQQFIYCDDIVFQGVETLSALAAAIESHDFWFFWWD